MKKLALLIVFLATVSIRAQDAIGVTVSVTIENVLSDKGTIIAGLHTAETFMKAPGVANTTAQAKVGSTTLTFDSITPGTYAVMVIHDANDNKQMDMLNGMPQESYGNSGEMNLYGPPVFNSSKFEVTTENKEINIRF
ncbi:DUF2141 domain-containing protein [Kriegella sp. EG-1]|nr:DUF2141 domain-containing protein [Flavobacteriaceae bacterium EG-1]